MKESLGRSTLKIGVLEGAGKAKSSMSLRLIFIMITQLSYKKAIINNRINNTMLIGNSSRPITRKAMLQKLWFT